MHRDDRHDAARRLDPRHVDVRERDVPDLALVPQALELADGVLEGDLRIDGV
jgi:hypothetical protein